ncbi:MAG: ketoacyl-ACP synthase III [bacterium]|nr:ketoacyl-ACP synthase III [bacterium]
MIIGTGHYVPSRILTNADLEKIVDTSNDWIVERTGIHERHIKADDENTSDMCIKAGERALQQSGLTAKDLDMIIIGTVTGDMRFPATAIFVQSGLGAVNAAALDISAACSGFLYGLVLADGLIASGKYRYILVIGSESLTNMTNWEDRNTCVLFGDGAGAAVVTASDGTRGIISSYLGADGTLAKLLWAPGGGTANPISHEMIDKKLHLLHMAGKEVFLHAVKAMCDAALKALSLAEMSPDDIDLLIPHQANIRIIEATGKRLGIPKEKVYVNIDRFGNTSSASVPIAIDEARRNGILKPGMTCLTVVFGGGFTWASVVIKF